MLVSAFGAPTPYSHWAFFVLGHVLDVLYGSHYRVEPQNLAELREKWTAREGHAVLITADKPTNELADFLIASDFPCLAFVDKPIPTITAPCEHLPFHEGIRFGISYIAMLDRVLPRKQVRVIDSDFLGRPLAAFVEAVLISILDDANPTTVGKIIDRLSVDSAETHVGELVKRHSGREISPLEQWESFPPHEKGIVAALADAYRPIFDRQPLTRLEWPLALVSTTGGGATIDLVGKARCLIWGPYLCLPPGRWRAKVLFEVIENFSGSEIEADVCIALETSLCGRASLPTIGLFEFSLEFTVPDPAMRVELRVHLRKGAIEGKLGLRKIDVELLEGSKAEPAEITTIEARSLA